MLKKKKAIRAVAKAVAEAVDISIRAFQNGRAMDEPAITGKILGSIEAKLEDFRTDGIAWDAHVLRTGRGIAAQEKKFGADILGALSIDLPEYKIKKGFLMQAKMAEPGESLSNKDWKRLKKQCETMLKNTQESFVIVYSREEGARIFSAKAIVAAETQDVFELYDRSVQSFFELYLECLIGDTRIKSADIKDMQIIEQYHAQNMLYIAATKAE